MTIKIQDQWFGDIYKASLFADQTTDEQHQTTILYENYCSCRKRIRRKWYLFDSSTKPGEYALQYYILRHLFHLQHRRHEIGVESARSACLLDRIKPILSLRTLRVCLEMNSPAFLTQWLPILTSYVLEGTFLASEKTTHWVTQHYEDIQVLPIRKVVWRDHTKREMVQNN